MQQHHVLQEWRPQEVQYFVSVDSICYEWRQSVLYYLCKIFVRPKKINSKWRLCFVYLI